MRSPERPDHADDIIRKFASRGIQLWAENGQLHYRAPKGKLTYEDAELLGNARDRILARLSAPDGPALSPSHVIRRERIPLTYPQLSYWYRYRLSERRHLRQIASLTHLRGRLSLDAFRASVRVIVDRHEALRTCITIDNGVPTQTVLETANCVLSIDDFSDLPSDDREEKVQDLLRSLILQPTDVTTDPLSEFRLVKIDAEAYVLIVVMEHIISDMASMHLLLRDLSTAYEHAANGRTFRLPRIPIQISNYALSQKEVESEWIEGHGPYWRARLAGCGRVRFPIDTNAMERRRSGWATLPAYISPELKERLVEWCKQRRVPLIMAIFAAYVAVVMRWCGVTDLVVRYMTDGRISPRLANTVGFFAFALHLRIQAQTDETFSTLLDRVREEYCKAYEHADFGFIESQFPRPEFAGNTCFNWIPRDVLGVEQYESQTQSERTVTWSQGSYERATLDHPMLSELELDAEPTIMLLDTPREINARVYFPADRFSVGTMERFVGEFLVFVERALSNPHVRWAEVRL